MSLENPYSAPIAHAVPKPSSNNNSGQGENTCPAGVKGWSWGAFFFNWIWAICNNTWIGLLVFVPGANLVMPFVLGFKGREWAWKNKRWRGVHHFNQVQLRWSVAAVIAMVIVSLIFYRIVKDEFDRYQFYGEVRQFNQASQAYLASLTMHAQTSQSADNLIFNIKSKSSELAQSKDLNVQVLEKYIHVTSKNPTIGSVEFIFSAVIKEGDTIRWSCYIADKGRFDPEVFDWCIDWRYQQ